jgi:putative flippase GtrA
MPDRPASGALARQFLSFTLVGLVGLAVDAGIFVWLTGTLLWSVALARALSGSGSIATTWALNRTLTFAERRSPRRGVELAGYVLVQLTGMTVNIGVFALCLWLVPRLRAAPVIALVIGCAAGFAFNFVALRTVVFRGSPRPS